MLSLGVGVFLFPDASGVFYNKVYTQLQGARIARFIIPKIMVLFKLLFETKGTKMATLLNFANLVSQGLTCSEVI